MVTKHVLDTHAIIWFLENHQALGQAAKALLSDPASELVLPVIALAEAVFIVDKGRTSLPDSNRY
jgi:PIN domain nuclease of toxin-antitoxin system